MMQIDSEQLAAWCGGVWDGGEPIAITGVSNDTRTLNPDYLYVAIRGDRFDGHDFVADAFGRGAAAAMVTREYDAACVCGPLLRVDDTITALNALARGYRDAVAPRMIGVTGSVGKSTVKEMIAAILAEVMPTAKTRGNWNNNIGLPLSILAMDSNSQAGVFEIGMNHPGEIEELCRVLKPEVGVVTTIGPVHLEFFKSVDAIADEKAVLLKALPEDGVAVLNVDDHYFAKLRGQVSCRLLTVSVGGDADYVVSSDLDGGMLAISETSTGESVSIPWQWPGRHNALNAGYAVAVARAFSVEWSAVMSGLQSYRPLSMRWEENDIKGVRIINDAYNANPLSMRSAIDTFQEIDVYGSRWLVLGDMLELGDGAELEHLALGKVVAGGAWDGVVTIGALGSYIAEGARAAGFDTDRIYDCKNVQTAAEVLRERLQTGDAVLLKASRGLALEKVIDELKI